MQFLEAVRSLFSGQSIKVDHRFAGTGYVKFKVKAGGFKPTWIVIHHSFSPDSGRTRDWDGIRKFHMSWRHDGDSVSEEEYLKLADKGVSGLQLPWTDIGYHFGVEKVKDKLQILNGRAIGTVGAHAVGFNTKSIGICVVGNFDLVMPSDDQLFLLSSLCRQLMREFEIPNDQVIGHRETFTLLKQPVLKSCPGRMFSMEEFRRRLPA